MTIMIPVLFVLAFMIGHVALFCVWLIGYVLVLPWIVTVTDNDEPLF
ncbi:hypothetical protein [Rossellomorea vietnamensis]|nr:hypothetical protein [Rossellomorea vietnamensis]